MQFQIMNDIEFLKNELRRNETVIPLPGCINLMEINKMLEEDLGNDFYKDYCMLDRVWKSS